jgi:hypothetical protein
MSGIYKLNGGVLGCPKILAKDFIDYSDEINSKIDTDGRLCRVSVAKLMDKEADNDYDVYLEINPNKVAIVNEIFGPLSNTNSNGTCYSAQIGKYHTDFIDLLHPGMGAAYYSASSGLVLHFLLKSAPFKLRATDLCCTLNGETFIISTDPNQVYSFLGLDLEKLLKTYNRQELFDMIEKSWLYDPIKMLELVKTKSKEKDLERPLMVDFLQFCETHPKNPKILSNEKTLHDVLEYFGKTDEYAALVQKQSEENRKKTARTKTKELLMIEFKKKSLLGKELGEKMNAFKEWILHTFQMDYDTWSQNENLDVEDVFKRFYISL